MSDLTTLVGGQASEATKVVASSPDVKPMKQKPLPMKSKPFVAAPIVPKRAQTTASQLIPFDDDNTPPAAGGDSKLSSNDFSEFGTKAA